MTRPRAPEHERNAAAADPEISVVIPHLNDAGRLGGCLESLAAQRLAPGRASRCWWSTTARREPPEELVAGFPGMRLVAEPTPGPGPARNRGIALARAPIVAFLDSDCIADPGWLPAILAGFAADPDCRILGGAVRIFAAEPARPNLAEAFDLVYGIRQEWTIARHGFAATANLAVRREVFEAVGAFAGLHDLRGHGMGDAGEGEGLPDPLPPDAVMRHPARRSMADLRRQWDRHISHHWSMQPKTVRGRAEWALRARRRWPPRRSPRCRGSSAATGCQGRAAAARRLQGVARMRLYRARRMLAELLDPAARQRSAQWNRS